MPSPQFLYGYQVRKDRQGVQDSSFVLVPAARNPKAVRFDLKADDGRLVRGVEFYNQERLVESDFDGCMAISAAWNEKDNLNVSVKPMCYIDDEASVLKEALQSGRISKTFVKNVYSGRETIATALVVTAVLKPKAKVSFQFCCWAGIWEIKIGYGKGDLARVTNGDVPFKGKSSVNVAIKDLDQSG